MKMNKDLLLGLLFFGLALSLKFFPDFDLVLLKFFNNFLFNENFFIYFTEFGNGWFAVALFSWSFVENVAPQSLFIKFVSISIILSVSAQVGDMIQSHLKRRSDVKDSSGLLPGHGGFMDRFDGFVGAMIVTGLMFEWIY